MQAVEEKGQELLRVVLIRAAELRRKMTDGFLSSVSPVEWLGQQTLNETGDTKVYCSPQSTVIKLATAVARAPLVPSGLIVLTARL